MTNTPILRGQLNNEKVFVKYTGTRSDSIEVIVDNTNYEIKAKLLNGYQGSNETPSERIFVVDSCLFSPLLFQDDIDPGEGYLSANQGLLVRGSNDDPAIKVVHGDNAVVITSSGVSKNGSQLTSEDDVRRIVGIQQKVVFSKYEFPTVGEEEVLYILDTAQDSGLYIWVDSLRQYKCIGRDYREINVINGGTPNGF